MGQTLHELKGQGCYSYKSIADGWCRFFSAEMLGDYILNIKKAA